MNFELSICIPTLNRAAFIGETLDSIVSQLTDAVEVVIVDGGSKDNTKEIVRGYQEKYPQIRFFDSPGMTSGPSNSGFDKDCNLAVELASGKYCWLMTDDDLLLAGAIQEVLQNIAHGYGLIIVSVEIRNLDLTKILTVRRPEIARDRPFSTAQWQEFAALTARHLTFVGAVVVDRQLWLSRDRAKFYGTGFVHLGVIFDKQVEQDTLVISKPLVTIRLGNAQWTSRAFQIWMFGWPQLMWSFNSISEHVKSTITPQEPWNNLRTLAVERAFGGYALKEYQLFLKGRFKRPWRQFAAFLIAFAPRRLFVMVAYLYAWSRPSASEMMLFELKQSLLHK